MCTSEDGQEQIAAQHHLRGERASEQAQLLRQQNGARGSARVETETPERTRRVKKKDALKGRSGGAVARRLKRSPSTAGEEVPALGCTGEH